MEQTIDAKAINETRIEIAKLLLSKTIKDGSKKDCKLNPFEYAACIVAGAITAWCKIMRSIHEVGKEIPNWEENKVILEELCKSAIHDAIGEESSINNQNK